MSRSTPQREQGIGTGTFSLFLIWTLFMLALIGFYLAVGLLHE